MLTALANAAASSGSGNTTAAQPARKDGAAAVSQQQFLNSAQHAGLFVEASLVRSDTGAPVAKCLDGNSMTRFERSSWNGGVLTATFKKLKILSTSQQLQVPHTTFFCVSRRCVYPKPCWETVDDTR